MFWIITSVDDGVDITSIMNLMNWMDNRMDISDLTGDFTFEAHLRHILCHACAQISWVELNDLLLHSAREVGR